MSKPLLVTGAGGHLGRRVVELLLAANAGPLIATTRDPEKLADLRARGVEVRRADFDAKGSLAEAFAGAERLLLVSTDALDRPGRRLEQHLAAIEAAAKAGVKHVVYTSAPKAGPSSSVPVVADHHGTEVALEKSALEYTVLRNNLYAELLLGALPGAVQSGQLYSAKGDGRTGYITREDCARAAAFALSASFSGRRVLEVTGPAAISDADVASIASEVTGKPITYVPISRAAVEDGLQKAGFPAPVAQLFAAFDEGISKGEFDVATGVVAELTGKAAEDVKSFLRRHAEVLLGSPAH